MKIWHRVAWAPRDDIKESLKSVGVKYDWPDPNLLIVLKIEETDPKWPLVSRLIKQWGGAHDVWTEFTEEEILAAEWLVALPARSIGHPAESHWSATYYDLSSQCPTCRTGWRQRAPFSIQRKPNLGKYHFAGFWGGYELFCTLEVVSTFEEEGLCGYEVWPVLRGKRRQEPVVELRQLLVPHIAQPALVTERVDGGRFADEPYVPEQCPTCGAILYSHILRGMIPLRREALRSDVDFQITWEWFGSLGTMPRREILVSRRVAELYIRRGWKGLHLLPVWLV
ncbi:MAG: hypothetical protein QXS54_12340 [Candidatus Methanomethylicaceae archaeon]